MTAESATLPNAYSPVSETRDYEFGNSRLRVRKLAITSSETGDYEFGNRRLRVRKLAITSSETRGYEFGNSRLHVRKLEITSSKTRDYTFGNSRSRVRKLEITSSETGDYEFGNWRLRVRKLAITSSETRDHEFGNSRSRVFETTRTRRRASERASDTCDVVVCRRTPQGQPVHPLPAQLADGVLPRLRTEQHADRAVGQVSRAGRQVHLRVQQAVHEVKVTRYARRSPGTHAASRVRLP